MRAILRWLSIARAIDLLNCVRYHNGEMTKQEAIDFFGTQRKVAEALGLKQPSIALWKDPLPELRQLQLEMVTGGSLRADPHCKRLAAA